MWDQLTTFWSLDRAEKHYSLKEQPLNMPLGSQNPYAKRAYYRLGGAGLQQSWSEMRGGTRVKYSLIQPNWHGVWVGL